MASAADEGTHIRFPEDKHEVNQTERTSTVEDENPLQSGADTPPEPKEQSEEVQKEDDEPQYERGRAKIAIIMLALGVSLV